MELTNAIRNIQPYEVGITAVIVYLAEHIIPERKERKDYRHDGINILIGLAGLLVVGVCGYVLQWCLTWLQQRQLGLLYYFPLWVQIAAGLLVIDLFMYWWHRANHRLAFFWYFHKFHHQDKDMNASSSIRFHVGELLFAYLLKLPFFALLGVSPGVVVLYGLLLVPVVTFNHSNVRIGKRLDRLFRLFFVSPQMHRIHHSVLVHESNSNYSAILPYWDRLFKSYRTKPEKPIEFGI